MDTPDVLTMANDPESGESSVRTDHKRCCRLVVELFGMVGILMG